jgi:methylated-DNA-protein-cysteine methyltransferase-like protein
MAPADRRALKRRSADRVYARIYRIVRRIPRGRVTTYGRVGQAAGCGARQVGYALHALRDGGPLPWHRVLNARGAISLRCAAGITQRLRLEREGVRFSSRGRVDLATCLWPVRSRAGGQDGSDVHPPHRRAMT